MVSKELASEISNQEVSYISVDSYNNILLYYTDDTEHSGIAINIYELAHKCKEWALLKHGFTITSFIFRIDAYPIGEYDGAAVLFFPDNETPSIRFDEATIAEAIFKACQYILDNKETK